MKNLVTLLSLLWALSSIALTLENHVANQLSYYGFESQEQVIQDYITESAKAEKIAKKLGYGAGGFVLCAGFHIGVVADIQWSYCIDVKTNKYYKITFAGAGLGIDASISGVFYRAYKASNNPGVYGFVGAAANFSYVVGAQAGVFVQRDCGQYWVKAFEYLECKDRIPSDKKRGFLIPISLKMGGGAAIQVAAVLEKI